MAACKSFEDLPIWQEARRLSKQVHELIKNNPGLASDYDLARQLRKSAGSIMDNRQKALKEMEMLNSHNF